MYATSTKKCQNEYIKNWKRVYRFPTTKQKERMADVRKAWLAAMVSVKSTLLITVDEADGTVALLLDPRLLWTKGARLMSFVAGMVATFLPQDFLPDCEVLRDVSGEKLEQLRVLLQNAVPDFGARAAAATLLFSSICDTTADVAAFHDKCDDQGPTLVLVKDTDGNAFGGYTRQSWRSPAGGRKYVSDPSAFLISVVNPFGMAPMLFPSSPGGCFSIIRDKTHGPSFGCGFGVIRSPDKYSWSSINGNQYINPTGIRHVLTGEIDFKYSLVEVYRL